MAKKVRLFFDRSEKFYGVDWVRLVTGVKEDAKDVWGLEGYWLPYRREIELEVGDVIVTGRHPYGSYNRYYNIYVVTEHGIVYVDSRKNRFKEVKNIIIDLLKQKELQG